MQNDSKWSFAHQTVMNKNENSRHFKRQKTSP